jgi:UDP-N-acetylmuramoylalanine--D-glutamate ligase
LQFIRNLKNKYVGKKVLVVGLGLQGGGVGIVRFFSELGAKVTVTDKKNETQLFQSIDRLKHSSNKVIFHLGGHNIEDFTNADVIFKGPSVPWDSPEIIEAHKKNIPIEMEMAFVVSNYPGKVIGITGTRGKSTTTNLIFNVLKENGFKVTLGGGLPGISTIECLKEAEEDSWLVAELSSWALSGFHRKKISPHIAVFTNFYPDHLNYYKNLDDYFYDKQAIFRYQKEEDYLVINKSLKENFLKLGLSFFDRHTPKGAPGDFQKITSPRLDKNFCASSTIVFSKSDFPYELTHIKGDHNLENAGATLKVAEILKIDKNKTVEIIKNFVGLPYRQQVVGKKGNVTFINDTTSTTPIATIKAIDALKGNKIILILGGNSKNLPGDQLINRLDRVKKIILLVGSFTDEVLPVLKEKYIEKLMGPFDNLEEAIKSGYEIAKDIDPTILLFSPGATSFAMFNNEFHRGEEFNRIVNKIINE